MKWLVCLVFALMIGSAVAQEDSGFVQEDAHEHGVALLNVVLDGEELVMEFISPAVNLIGFEYAPESDDEIQAVNDTLAALEDDPALFTVSGDAGCTLLSAETEHVMTDEEGHEHGDGHDHDEHGDDHDHDEDKEHGDEEHDEDKEHGDEEHDEDEHSDEHGDEHDHDEHSDEHDHDEHSEDHDEDKEHDEHGDEHDHDEHDHDEHSEGAQHSEFHANYSFSCSNPDNLSGLELGNLFASYPGIEDLDVQYVLPSGQGADELGADNANLTF